MTNLTFSDISVLDAALIAFRKTGDKRYTEEQYDALDAKLAALGTDAVWADKLPCSECGAQIGERCRWNDGGTCAVRLVGPERAAALTDVSKVRAAIDGLSQGQPTVRTVSDALIALDRIAAALLSAES